MFALIAELGAVPEAEMQRVFNMGTGFVCVTAQDEAEDALEVLRRHHPDAARIGSGTAEAGTVRLPEAGLVGDASGFRKL